MSAKHTPGPWRELHTCIDDSRGYQICHIDLHGKSEAERDANRRLIAAAPELLDALKDMLDYYGTASANVEFLTKARAAIAKATGQDAKA